MKRISTFVLAIGLLAAVLALAACNNNTPKAAAPAKSGHTVAVVDAAVVLQQCEPGKTAMEYVQKLSNDLQADLAEMQKAVTANQTEENTMAFQQALGEAQGKLSSEQNRLMQLLQNSMEKVVDEYRAKNDIDVIILESQALAYNPALNATGDLLKAMNALNLEIAPKAE